MAIPVSKKFFNTRIYYILYDLPINIRITFLISRTLFQSAEMGKKNSDTENTNVSQIYQSPKTENNARSGENTSVTRRGFLGTLGGAAVATGLLGITPVLTGCNDEASGQAIDCTEIGPLDQTDRLKEAFDIRVNAAQNNFDLTDVQHVCNGDEEFYADRIGSYTKALPHNQLGEVDQQAYDQMINALSSGNNEDFENIPLGADIKLKNPFGGLAFDLVGFDSHQSLIPAPPAFGSAEAAGEMVELYWMSLARDIHFQSYDNSTLIDDAVEDLNSLSDFRGPRQNGLVTPSTIFRADIPGVLQGPFLSQFILKDVPAGPKLQEHKIRTLLPADYVTDYSEWLDIQNGALTQTAISPSAYDDAAKYIRNGRDLAEDVHWDWPAQEAINALLIIFSLRGRSPQEVFLANIGVPYDQGNPYNNSATQAGFVTFHIVDAVRLVTEAMNLALKAAWYQKWFVHRRLRPEEFGGRVHNNFTGSTEYPIHEDVFNSTVLDRIFDLYGTYLLPQAYPEGGPCHPAYPSGHATWGGATATVLKAFFDESAVVPDPVVSSSDGTELIPYSEPGADSLTVGGELNKLAWNIAMGRNYAGIHWRTDATMGLALGEQVGISVLKDLKATYAEDFDGFNLTGFDGTPITI